MESLTPIQLNYLTGDHKSYLQFNINETHERFHVYERRNLLTCILYLIKKYLSLGQWKERSVNIDNKQRVFLVKTSSLNEIDRKLTEIAKGTVNRTPRPISPAPPKDPLNEVDAATFRKFGIALTVRDAEMLKSVATEAKQQNSIALFADHLRLLRARYGKNDTPIIKLYNNFLRTFTGTPEEEEITLNGLHVRAMQKHPVKLGYALTKTEELIQRLEKSDDPIQKLKGFHFRENFNLYKEFNKHAINREGAFFGLRISVLENPKDFSFENGNFPGYLKTTFSPKPGFIFTETNDFLNYRSFKDDIQDVDFASADFANVFLGGGALTHGRVQEEIQALEFPEFIMLMALYPSPIKDFSSALSTRNPNDIDRFSKRSHPGKGSPDPLKIAGLTRIKRFEGYKNDLFTKPYHILNPEPNITLVAAAAPHIDSSKKFDFEVLLDTFNTIYAEMQLQKDHADNPGNVGFASGRIGAGVFNNDPGAVYLLHRLAAAQLGIHVKLHAYNPNSPETNGYKEMWNTLCPTFEHMRLCDCVAIIASALSAADAQAKAAEATARPK